MNGLNAKELYDIAVEANKKKKEEEEIQQKALYKQVMTLLHNQAKRGIFHLKIGAEVLKCKHMLEKDGLKVQLRCSRCEGSGACSDCVQDECIVDFDLSNRE